MNEIIGQSVDRLDGRQKVTGTATYAAEFPLKGLAYCVTVQSTIAKGRIHEIDGRRAESAPGVLAVITCRNSEMLHQPNSEGNAPGSFKLGEKDLLPLQSDRIHYDGQHIALVVAETFEQAEYAATLVNVDYEEERPLVEIEDGIRNVYKPQKMFGQEVQVKRGDPAGILGSAEIKVDETYSTPIYHHNPMEPHATTAEWVGDELTIYDSTQAVMGTRNAVAQLLGLPADKVKVISPFVGGGFGCKGFVWPHTVMAAMAAKKVGRPVRLVLDRQQMFTCNGHRSRTIQKVSLSADRTGKLTAAAHDTTSETSFVDEFVETAGGVTPILYDVPAVSATQNLVRLNKGTPCPTRAPGEAPGTFALESAMDELAYKLKIDPVDLRLLNYAEKNQKTGQQWSSKYLRECYERGAAAINWQKRNPAIRSMREGKYLVGYGMATAVYPANRMASSAKVQMTADGFALVTCCTQDIGTGTYTIMAQIAAEALGIPVDRVRSKLGDSSLPGGANSGGSQTSASVGPPIRAAALGVKSKAIQLAVTDRQSPLYGQQEQYINVAQGKFVLASDSSKSDTYEQILRRNNKSILEEEATTTVSTREGAESKPKDNGSKKDDAAQMAVKQDEETDRKPYSFFSFGAQFARVLVDPNLGIAKVDHCVSVMDVGKILNLKTATNQVMGGMIFSLGMALMEKTEYDHSRGRVITRDLANYLVPVNADMPTFDVQFIDKPDPYISPIGSRGVGEIGITGTTAAIANAVYHATGKRIRHLPITPDKLI